jgi:hypothetical protein
MDKNASLPFVSELTKKYFFPAVRVAGEDKAP